MRRDGPVAVIGYSMGASLASACTADPGLLTPSTLTLVEPVAMQRWNLIRLLRAVHTEDAAVERYLEDNGTPNGNAGPVPSRDVPTPARSRIDLAHLGFALSRGRLTCDLLRTHALRPTPVQLVHGVDSRLSGRGEVARAVARCRRAGMEIQDLPVAGRHPLWQSLLEVTALARLTRERWPS